MIQIPLPCRVAAALALCSAANAAYEIADVSGVGADYTGYTKVYIDYGDNPITTPEQWDAYTPPPGFMKNTPRNGEFNEETTLSSPGQPAPEVTIYTDPSGYTWKFIAQTQSAMWPYAPETNPYQAAAFTTTPAAGTVKYSSNEKNQIMTFWARENNDPSGAPIQRFFITDEWGNTYILGAAGVANDADIPASFEASVLPAGWTKSTGYLDETIHLFPAYGAGNQAHYNLFRESSDNTFFQITWSTSGNTIANQIKDMPIWGGATSDIILGRPGDDNLIHGAEGDDTIHLLGWNDIVYGDTGIDTVVFTGDFSDYTLLDYADDGAWLVLSGGGYVKTLYDVEFLQFDDGTFATSAIPEPGTIALLALALTTVMALRSRRARTP
jgi:PEP-CTERM putative exosortase interaction domain